MKELGWSRDPTALLLVLGLAGCSWGSQVLLNTATPQAKEKETLQSQTVAPRGL